MITLKIPDAIIVASDSCMTITKHNDIVIAQSYTEHTPKMIIFKEKLVVTYCGDMNLNNDLSVLQFLQNIRLSFPKNGTPKSLSETILKEYKKISDGNTIFLISGYIKDKPYIFRIYTNNNNIEEPLPYNYGAVYHGETNYVHSMMKSVANYSNLSIKDGIQLISTMMYCMSNLSKFWESQTIGGDIDIYLMCRDKKNKIWLDYKWTKNFYLIKINEHNE